MTTITKKTRETSNFPQTWQTIKYQSDALGEKYSDKVMYFYNTEIHSDRELIEFFENSPHESCYDVAKI
jgi:hypothetical protein